MCTKIDLETVWQGQEGGTRLCNRSRRTRGCRESGGGDEQVEKVGQ